MLRLRMWARIGLVALFVATTTAWVTVSVVPSVALAGPGTKTLDPSAGDPNGGDPTVGDPDGPTGDISPSGGAVSGGSSLGSGAYSPSVQGPAVGIAAPVHGLSLWARFKLALGFWLRSALLRL